MKAFLKKTRYTLVRFFYVLTGEYISFVRRPLYAAQVAYTPRPVIVPKKTAVIIQGPLKLEESFTVETVRLYKKTLLPSTHIIVSTWEDEDPAILAELQALGAHVVISRKPENRGIYNINFQITSVVSALRKCSELKVDFVLKTRTDTRMYAPNIEEYLAGLLESFPPSSKYNQKYRILGLSLNTHMYRLYSVSDIVLYGHINDMKKYWEIPLDTRTTKPDDASWTLRAWSQARMVETCLTTTFLETVGKTLSWTLEDSFRAYADHFIIIDEQSLDLYWYKYKSWQEYRNRNYKIKKNDVYITFRDWLTFYSNQHNLDKIPEFIIDLPFGSEIDDGETA